MKLNFRMGLSGSVLVLMLVTSASALARHSSHSGIVNFPYAASLNGTQLSAGQYKISWQQHSPEATVIVRKGRTVLATAQAKWVDRDVLYRSNAIMYNVNADGSRKVLEIRFAGLKGALVFGEESPKS